MAEPIDQRLICGTCGELGKLIRRDSYWLVTCGGSKPRGACCQTHLRNTEEEAIESWQRLHDDGEAQNG